ncbi:AdoMet-homocysteine methyltransferase [Tulasnella sp. 418]|nr:AdoMet-homocysteine methyltransferase [Tulasnella sp. 418]
MTFNNDSATPSFSDILKTIPELNRTLPYDHTDHDTISQGLIDCQVDNLSSNPSPDLPIVLFDGGMGTTLEDVYHQDISNNALWSARLIDNDPNVLIRLHLDYLRSGSKIFSTAT